MDPTRIVIATKTTRTLISYYLLNGFGWGRRQIFYFEGTSEWTGFHFFEDR